MKKSIAFFDFDGTITFKDTLIEIVKYQHGVLGLLKGFVKLSPWMIAMKLKLLSNQQVKEMFLKYFFANEQVDVFQKKCDAFTQEKMDGLIRPAALSQIKTYQQNNTQVVLVSASPENWLAGWCKSQNITCIATKLEVKEGRITGKINGLNCYGEEKVRRIREAFDLDLYEEVFCYGDTKGDKPMLSLATSAFYKPFR